MAALVPPAEQHCNFELKNYKTVFTCYVCMVDSHDTERYRCNHCDLARHKSCLRLKKTILLCPGPDNIFPKERVPFKLFDKPQTGQDSKNKKWAEYCMVCGMLIKHYSYYFKSSRKRTFFSFSGPDETDLNMHPCCAKLARSGSPSPHKLKFTKETSRCVWCGEDRPKEASPHGPENFFCWSYKLIVTGKHIHVHCYSEMVIQALKSIVPSDQNDNAIRIVLRQRKDTGIGWKTLGEAIKTAMDLAGLNPTQILLNWISTE